MEFLSELQALGEKIIRLVEAGIDLASEQFPVVAREALTYWTTMAIFSGIIEGILIVVLVFATIGCTRMYFRITKYDNQPEGELREKYRWMYQEDTDEVYGVAALIFGLVLLVMVILYFAWTTPNLIKALTAPSLFFLENAAKLFK